VEFVRPFPLAQTFHLQIIYLFLLSVSFQNQRMKNRFQRFAVLR
jgi:hypothetical protein